MTCIRRRRAAPVLALLPALAACVSTPEGPDGGEVPCPRPELGEARIAGLPETFEPASLEGRWHLTVVTTSGVETPSLHAAPLVLLPSPDSLYVHPFCLEGGACAARYPLRGWFERPLGLDLSAATDPTSADPEAPGVVLEWRPGSREAVLDVGNPPVRGRLVLDAGASFAVMAVEPAGGGEPARFAGYWNDGGLGTFVTPEGRDLGGLGGWFCAERMSQTGGAAGR